MNYKAKHDKIKVGIEGRALIVDHYSGVGHYLSNLIKGLELQQTIHESDHTYSLILPFRARKKAPHFKVRGFGYQYILLPSRIYSWLSKKNLLPPLDIFLGKKTYFFPNYLSWPLIRSPSVVVIYDLVFKTHPEFVVPANLAFLNDAMPKLINSATEIVTISKNSKREIHEYLGVPKDRISIVYPAADKKLFYKRSKEEISHVKAKYNIHGEYLLFVGNIEPRKNLARLLKAIDKLPDNLRSKHSLVVVGGDSWLSEDVNSQIIKLRKKGLNIIIPDLFVPDEDLPALYTGAKVFVFPSLYEGFGMPLVEAMSCGTPVLCANNSSIPEVVDDAAFYVDAKSVSSINKGLEEILTDEKLRKRLSRAGLQQSKKFSWKKSASELMRVLDKAQNRGVR